MCTDGLGVGVYCSGGSRFFRALLVVLNFLPTVLRRSAAPGCSPSPWVPNKSPFESACGARGLSLCGSERTSTCHIRPQTSDDRARSSLQHTQSHCVAQSAGHCVVWRAKKASIRIDERYTRLVHSYFIPPACSELPERARVGTKIPQASRVAAWPSVLWDGTKG